MRSEQALQEVSAVLDGLLGSGVPAANFMVADRSVRFAQSAPSYLLDFIRNAETCTRFEGLSRGHATFIGLMISHVGRRFPGAAPLC